MALTGTQIVRMVIFLKEAGAQLDNARLVARAAADPQTESRLAALVREIVAEITYLEMIRQNQP